MAVLLAAVSLSCKTTEHASPALGGLATTSALVAALPLIPFAGAYHLVSGDVRKQRRAEQKLQEALDPVYQKRIELVEKRDPVGDAGQAWLDGFRAFLPSLPRGNLFPGIEGTEYHLKREFGDSNHEALQQSEFLRYLEVLMSKDPLHDQQKEVHYFSDKFKEFIRVCWDYRKAFNREMYSRLQKQDGERSKP
jgi:hypothetical protein